MDITIRDASEVAVAPAEVGGDVAAVAAAPAAVSAAPESPVVAVFPPAALLPHEHAAEEPDGPSGSGSHATTVAASV